jgi:hypothetical protein
MAWEAACDFLWVILALKRLSAFAMTLSFGCMSGDIPTADSCRPKKT